MGNSLFRTFLFFAILFFSGSGFAAESVLISGNVFYRPPQNRQFEKASEGILTFSDNCVFSVLPDLKNPLATDSCIVYASQTMILFPGTVVKFSKGTIYPLAGRLAVSSEKEKADQVVFRGSRYFCQFHHGELLLENTPENTTWILMQNKGQGWVKDLTRKIIELQPGTQVEIPPFASTVVKERPDSRWERPPQCAVVADVAAVFNPETVKSASDTSELDEDSNEELEEDGLTESEDSENSENGVPIASDSAQLEEDSHQSASEEFVASSTSLASETLIEEK